MDSLKRSSAYLSSIEPEVMETFRKDLRPEKIPKIAEHIFHVHFKPSRHWIATKIVIVITMTVFYSSIENSCLALVMVALIVTSIPLYIFGGNVADVLINIAGEQWRKIIINFRLSWNYLHRLINEEKGEFSLQQLFLEKTLNNWLDKKKASENILKIYSLYWWFLNTEINGNLIELFKAKKAVTYFWMENRLAGLLLVKNYPEGTLEKAITDAQKIYEHLSQDEKKEFVECLERAYKSYSITKWDKIVDFVDFVPNSRCGYNILAVWAWQKLRLHATVNSNIYVGTSFCAYLKKRWIDLKDHQEIIPPILIDLFSQSTYYLKALKGAPLDSDLVHQVFATVSSKISIQLISIMRPYTRDFYQTLGKISDFELSIKIFKQLNLEIAAATSEIISSEMRLLNEEELNAEKLQDCIIPKIHQFYETYKGPYFPIKLISNSFKIDLSYKFIMEKSQKFAISLACSLFNRMKKEPQQALEVLSKSELKDLKSFCWWVHRVFTITKSKMPKPVQGLVLVQLFADNKNVKFIGIQPFLQLIK